MTAFKILKLQIKAIAIDDIHLPDYAGAVFRGNFGHAFKDVACLTLQKKCNTCEKKAMCAYAQIFETDYPDGIKSIKRLQKPPRPYIIDPPSMNMTHFEKGKSVHFGLTLVGKAIDYLPYFIFTFKEMGKIGIGKGRGQFYIEDVAVYKENDNHFSSIFKSVDQRVINTDDNNLIIIHNDNNGHNIPDTIKLKFVTPINIVVDKSSKHNLEFHALFSRLLARVNALSLLYCGEEFTDEHTQLIEESRSIKTIENSTCWYQFKKHSNRQQKSFVAGGYLGEITYSGDFSKLYNILLAGTYVNAGKNTTLGFGKYEIEG